MSLPIPSSSGAPIDPKQLQALDAPLIALTQQCGGDLRRVLFSFFSFLHRRTDFYLVPHPDDPHSKMGFQEGDAEKLLLAAFRQFPLRRIPKGQGGPPTSAAASKKPAAPITASSASNANIPNIKKATAATRSSESATPQEQTSVPAVEQKKPATKSVPEPEADNDIRYTEEGLQVPVGNGGSSKNYKWTQTIEECSVLVGVPKELRGKDLDVKITSTTLSIKAKKEPRTTFVEGTLVEKVRADDSTWSVEGGVVIVTLDKSKQTFWKSVFVGDEEIDTELVDNRRHIDEYDDATQAKIRRIIFDQEQYHKGGPTSDEILGQKPSDGKAIPPLPPGVEFIDKKKLDEEDKRAKQKQ